MNLRLFAADIRFACRGLLCRRGSTFGAVSVLACGIGLATAMFAIADPFVFRQLPYSSPNELALIDIDPLSVSDAAQDSQLPTIEDWRSFSALFTDVAAYSYVGPTTVDADYGAAPFHLVAVTPNFFAVLGNSPPNLSRLPIAPRTDPSSEIPALLTLSGRQLLSNEMAQPGSLIRGRDGQHFRVVGNLPDEFLFPNPLWRGYSALTTFEGGRLVPAKGCCVRVALARVRPGISTQALKEALTHWSPSGRKLEMRVNWLTPAMRGSVRPLAIGGFFSAVLVLLVCVGNVANLSLVRHSYRRREFEIRGALGASKGDLIRFSVFESVMTAAMAVGVGICVAWSFIIIAGHVIPTQFTVLGTLRLTSRVASFAMLVGLVITGAILVPVDILAHTLLDRSRGAARPGGAIRIVFAAVQAALAMILAVGAALLTDSYLALVSQDPGYDGASEYVNATYPFGRRGETLRQDVEATVAKLSALPGVRVAAAASGSIVRDGQKKRAVAFGGQVFFEDAYSVTTGFMEAAGMTLLRGRTLAPEDRGTRGVIVNEAFARRYFSQKEAVGEIVTFTGVQNQPALVVGVVRNALVGGPAVTPAPTIYKLLDKDDYLGTINYNYIIRPKTEAPGHALVRRVIAEVNHDAIIGTMQPIEVRLADAIRDRTFATLVLVLFAVSSGIVSITGLVVMVAFIVARRTKDFAIRIALGASSRHLRRLATREASIAALLGGASGVIVGRWLSLLLESLVFGVKAGNWMIPLMAGSIMMAVMYLAALVPTRRAVRIEPTDALRQE
jgi:predicted permease